MRSWLIVCDSAPTRPAEHSGAREHHATSTLLCRLQCACYLAGSFAASVITGAIACGLCLFILWWVVRAQARLDLVARLLSIASEGLAANPMVGPLSLGLNGAFFIAAVPFGAAIYAASGNGALQHALCAAAGGGQNLLQWMRWC